MNIIGIQTLVKKELVRTFRVPFQTLGQPVITTLLYFLVFGYAIGRRIGMVEGLSYTEFIMPGLIMMNILTTAFFSISSGLIISKMLNTLSDLLVSPMSYLDIVIGYTFSSVFRSILVGILIFLTALFFVPLRIDHFIFLIFFTVLVSATFSLFGLIVGIWADNFEQVSVFPTFFMTPLAFMGGIFYSINMLPPIAQTISKFNPFFYMINGMRYGFYGVTDINHWIAVLVVTAILAFLILISWNIFRTGYKIRS